MLSRPHLRQSGILDLPDELLVQISEYLKGCVPTEDQLEEREVAHLVYHRRDISNTRLTCKRLCNTSSHLLIDFLHVHFDPASLAHLERVSSHPVIGTGVKAVRLHLDFYSSTLANNIESFASYCTLKLRKYNAVSKSGAKDYAKRCAKDFAKHRSENSYERDVPVSWEAIWENVKKVAKILDSWEEITSESDEDDILEYQILREAHEEYQRRYVQQEKMLQNGAFIDTFASAISKMPHARILQIREGHERYARGPKKKIWQGDDIKAVHRGLIEHMLIMHRWADARQYQMDPPPTEMLVKLPVAIYKAGVSFSTITIKVTPPENFPALTSREDLQHLTAAVQRLKKFTMELPARWPNLAFVRDPSEVEDLFRFLRTLLSTDSLEELLLDFRSLSESEDEVPNVDFSSVINVRPWRQLRRIELRGFTLHLSAFERVLKQCKTRPTADLITTRLITGTWAECLDVLRDHADLALIVRPRGAECDELDEDELESIFGEDGAYNTDYPANSYICGANLSNPLREPPEVSVEDSDEEMNDEGSDAESNDAGPDAEPSGAD